jgi:hypothetical protein
LAVLSFLASVFADIGRVQQIMFREDMHVAVSCADSD